MKKIGAVFFYGVPLAAFGCFLLLFLPLEVKVPYIKSFSEGKNEFGMLIPGIDGKGMQIVENSPRIDFFPIFELIKVPKELTEFSYCISHQPFVINADEEPVPSDDPLVININGKENTLPPKAEICLDKKPTLAIRGFLINLEETKEQAKSWGLVSENNTGRSVSAYDLITRKTKPTNLLVFPVVLILIFVVWCAILKLFYEAKKLFA